MKRFDKYLRQMAAEETTEMPEAAKEQMEAVLSSLPERGAPAKRIRLLWRVIAAGVCLGVMMLFVLPNVSAAYAQALEQVPVIGDIVKVFTIRHYVYLDEYHEMSIRVPEISNNRGSEAASLINQDINGLTTDLVNRFYEDLEIVGNEGHGSIYVDYDVITNTEEWFTLRLSVYTVAGSGCGYFKYYHIDRQTGNYVNLGDLFSSGDFSQVLMDQIQGQMRQQMEEDSKLVYWTEDAMLTPLEKTHNFYLNADGQLVIPFDKYEAGPGYMGCPEFVIPKAAVEEILDPRFADLVK